MDIITEVTDTTPIRVGEYVPASVSASEVKKAVNFAVERLNSFDSVSLTVKQIISAKEQIVSGLNIKTEFLAIDRYGHEFFVRDTVYSQPWSNTVKLTSMTISPELHGHSQLYGGYRSEPNDIDQAVQLTQQQLLQALAISTAPPVAAAEVMTSIQPGVMFDTSMLAVSR